MAAIGVIVVSLLAAVVAALANGVTMSILWGWFIVPVFAVPSLSVLQAIGVCLVVSFLCHPRKADPDAKRRKWGDALVEAVIFTLVYYPCVLGVAWCIHKAMP